MLTLYCNSYDITVRTARDMKERRELTKLKVRHLNGVQYSGEFVLKKQPAVYDLCCHIILNIFV
jgi:CRISPR/Cas system-associated endoribonuclease Cas2